jgi:hypothetical protein
VKSCTDLFSFNEMNHVSLVTTANTPLPITTTSADISTMDDEPPSSASPGNRQATPTSNEPIGDSHRTLPCQIDAASESTDTEVNVDTSGDSLLLGELMVGEEMIEVGGEGGRGEEGGGVSREGGKDGGGEEKMVKETRKPPVIKRYIKFMFRNT